MNILKKIEFVSIMKNNFLYKQIIVLLLLLTTCNLHLSAQNSKGEIKLTDDVDSLAYYIGIAQTQGLKEYLVERMGVDIIYMNDFLKGLIAGAQSSQDPVQNAYAAGIQIGQQLSNQMVEGINAELFGEESDKTISLPIFLAGFIYGINNEDEETISKAQDEMQRLMQLVKEAQITPDQAEYKKKNEEWLAVNKTKPGIQTLPSGVQYKIIKQGTGKKPTEDSEIECHYEGRLIDGSVFDSSYERGESASFKPNQVIPGWTDALLEMPVGSIWEVYIPQELAYGSREMGSIKPYSTLVFKIELIAIK